jgi:3-phosphoshikimate 1-carboxyvinyltransferase
MIYQLHRNNKVLKGELRVPASKSISNRLLIIQAICNSAFQIGNLSDSEDSRVLLKALSETGPIADIGHAGTSMRFLTAFYASRSGEKILTGSLRMKERPIGNLVKALQTLGADISYMEKDGFPPLRIQGRPLKGGSVSINSSVSSQFISALLLMAPTFKEGLELQLENKTISSSYIELTLKLMEFMGVKVEKSASRLTVVPQEYKPHDIFVEGDWSGVSYWYEMAAFSNEADILIHSLNPNSFQGDARCADIFRLLGIYTEYKSQGIRIYKGGEVPSHFEFDFIDNPDLVQTLAVTCVMLNISFRFSGTQSLRIKETDRIAALQSELEKFGAELTYYESGILEWDGTKQARPADVICIETYQDHRMALAFAPIAILVSEIRIKNPEVVVKSYPEFWSDLKSMGFDIVEEAKH